MANLDLPLAVKTIITRMHSDENQHLSYEISGDGCSATVKLTWTNLQCPGCQGTLCPAKLRAKAAAGGRSGGVGGGLGSFKRKVRPKSWAAVENENFCFRSPGEPANYNRLLEVDNIVDDDGGIEDDTTNNSSRVGLLPPDVSPESSGNYADYNGSGNEGEIVGDNTGTLRRNQHTGGSLRRRGGYQQQHQHRRNNAASTSTNSPTSNTQTTPDILEGRVRVEVTAMEEFEEQQQGEDEYGEDQEVPMRHLEQGAPNRMYDNHHPDHHHRHQQQEQHQNYTESSSATYTTESYTDDTNYNTDDSMSDSEMDESSHSLPPYMSNISTIRSGIGFPYTVPRITVRSVTATDPTNDVEGDDDSAENQMSDNRGILEEPVAVMVDRCDQTDDMVRVVKRCHALLATMEQLYLYYDDRDHILRVSEIDKEEHVLKTNRTEATLKTLLGQDGEALRVTLEIVWIGIELDTGW